MKQNRTEDSSKTTPIKWDAAWEDILAEDKVPTVVENGYKSAREIAEITGLSADRVREIWSAKVMAGTATLKRFRVVQSNGRRMSILHYRPVV